MAKKLRAIHCTELIEKIRGRIYQWHDKVLRMLGDYKSVLRGIHNYWTSAMILPKEVIKEVEKIIANFLWGSREGERKSHNVSWDQCCMPLEKEVWESKV